LLQNEDSYNFTYVLFELSKKNSPELLPINRSGGNTEKQTEPGQTFIT